MLNIINKSPMERTSLASCLSTMASGTILLIEDAVYAATRGHASAVSIAEAVGKFKIFVLLPDAEARGVADRLIDGVATVDYNGFVDLVVESKVCHSWL